MFRIIKIKFLIFFSLISTDCNAFEKPPLENILVSKNPIEYKNIDFEDFEGKIINLNNKSSKIYILNFWATWCQPCREEFPHSKRLMEKFEGQDIEFVYLSVDELGIQ